MDPQTDHERCSELLRDYVAGELPGSESTWVEEHLAGCTSCRAEASVVRDLFAEEVDPLSELESSRLHRAVWSSIHTGAGGIVIAPGRRSWARRVSPALGAAALIALVAVGAAQVMKGPSDNAASLAQRERATDGSEAGVGSSSAGSAGAGGSGPVNGPKAESKAKTTVSAAQISGPRPTFAPRVGRVGSKDLKLTGSTAEPFTSFATAYKGRDATRLQGAFLQALSRKAPDAQTRGDIRTCGNSVMDRGGDYRFLPAYGGYATIRNHPALLIGFVYAFDRGEALDRFQLWAWRRPGCDEVLLYSKGPVRP
jgi:hypothetical protein